MEKEELKNIVVQFAIQGSVGKVTNLGRGLINDSFHVYNAENGKPDYVLQHINNNIFEDVDMLMNNIIAVTTHIRKKYEAMGMRDIGRKVLHFLPLKDNTEKYYTIDTEGQYWRLMEYIPSTVKTEVNEETAYEVGISFGNFQAILSDMPMPLGETIPHFHNMEFRMQQLKDAIKDNKANRLTEVQKLVNDIMQDEKEMCKGEQLYREGKLPKRICHCDTKVDNLLFDDHNNVLCVVDLDTVMPNFVFSDIGDFLRSAANTSKEDEPDLDKVNFNFPIFRAFIKGYLRSGSSFLLPIEIENIPYATQLFPYMQAVRFLTDYLNGDTYYKIQYPEHNLVRTRAQYKLYQSVKAHTVHMRSFIQECLGKAQL